MIVLRADFFLADPRTASDAVVEAGAVGVHRPGSLPQREHPLHQEQGAAQQAHIDIGPVKAIQGAAEATATGDENPWVGLTPGDAEVGVFLVVLQQHVEVRLMVLDQVRLENEGLRLAVGDDELNLTDLACHQPDPWRQIVAAAEIAAYAAAQCL